MTNIFSDLPEHLDSEVFETLAYSETVKIERIISDGHATPISEWYDQDQNEWVLLLEGEALLVFEVQDPVHLLPGDYLNIPAHLKHRVDWTTQKQKTIWLAIFY